MHHNFQCIASVMTLSGWLQSPQFLALDLSLPRWMLHVVHLKERNLFQFVETVSSINACSTCTHVHRGAITVATHKNPIGLLGLCGDRQKVRPLIVFSEHAADLLVAVTPLIQITILLNTLYVIYLILFLFTVCLVDWNLGIFIGGKISFVPSKFNPTCVTFQPVDIWKGKCRNRLLLNVWAWKSSILVSVPHWNG